MFVHNNRRRKTRNAIMITIGALLLILIACIAGYNYSRAEVKREGQQKAEEDVYPSLNIPISTPSPTPTVTPWEYNPAMAVTDNMGNDNILLDTATLDIIYEYDMCGHEHTTTVTEGLGGKTPEELEAEYSGCTVEEFTPEHARIRKMYKMYCPNHYVLTNNGGQLEILRTVAGKEEMVLDRVIEDVYVPPDDELNNGIVFDSLEAIELYLENVES